MILIAVSALIALALLLLLLLAGVDPLTALLATSPSGAHTVAIIAQSTHVDVAYVMAMQLARFLPVMFTGPALDDPARRIFAHTVVRHAPRWRVSGR